MLHSLLTNLSAVAGVFVSAASYIPLAVGVVNAQEPTSKLLPLDSPEQWLARQQALEGFIQAMMQRINKLQSAGLAADAGIPTATSRLYLQIELANLALDVTKAMQGHMIVQGLMQPHAAVMLRVPASTANTFLRAIYLLCEDLPPYDPPGTPPYGRPGIDELAITIAATCSDLTAPVRSGRGPFDVRSARDRVLAPEFKAAIQRDVAEYGRLCAEARWAEAEALAEPYWKAVRRAALEGVVELPEFDRAGAIAVHGAGLQQPVLGRADIIAWLEGESMAVERARARAQPDEFPSLTRTRSAYFDWLLEAKSRVIEQTKRIDDLRIEAEEYERAGIAVKAGAAREAIRRLEQSPPDIRTEIEVVALSLSSAPEQLRASAWFYLLPLERADLRFRAFHAAIDGTIEALREQVAGLHAQLRQNGNRELGHGKGDLATLVSNTERFANELIDDLEAIRAAHERNDPAAMLQVLGPVREAIRGAREAPGGPVAGSHDQPPGSAPSGPVFRTIDIEFAGAKELARAAQLRAGAIQKAMKKRGHIATQQEYEALWRAQTAMGFYRAIVDHMRRDGSTASDPPVVRSIRIVDLQGGFGPYSFAMFDAASLATAAGAKAWREWLQAQHLAAEQEVARLAQLTMPAFVAEHAAARSRLMAIEAAMDLLKQGDYAALQVALDRIWASVLAP